MQMQLRGSSRMQTQLRSCRCMKRPGMCMQLRRCIGMQMQRCKGNEWETLSRRAERRPPPLQQEAAKGRPHSKRGRGAVESLPKHIEIKRAGMCSATLLQLAALLQSENLHCGATGTLQVHRNLNLGGQFVQWEVVRGCDAQLGKEGGCWAAQLQGAAE